jgi:hypothetical protein
MPDAGQNQRPARVYRRTLIDEADDATHGPVDELDDSLDFDDNDRRDSAEHRARVVESLKRGG